MRLTSTVLFFITFSCAVWQQIALWPPPCLAAETDQDKSRWRNRSASARTLRSTSRNGAMTGKSPARLDSLEEAKKHLSERQSGLGDKVAGLKSRIAGKEKQLADIEGTCNRRSPR